MFTFLRLILFDLKEEKIEEITLINQFEHAMPQKAVKRPPLSVT